jgi:DNA-directed RNA polymerase specialized sigma subunit
MSLEAMKAKIHYCREELDLLVAAYDKEYAAKVKADDDLNARLTVPQILHLVPLTEGTLRNRMSREPLRSMVTRCDGKSALCYKDVKAHLLTKARGRISAERVKVILNLRNTTDMTQEQIAETLNLSRRTIQRVLEREASTTASKE